MLLRIVPVDVFTEGDRFLAKDTTWGIISEGITQEEAMARLRKGLEIRTQGAAVVPMPMGELHQGGGCPSNVSLGQAVARLGKDGFQVASEGESHIKMVKVIEEEGLRPQVVLIPCPASGEELLATASLISILEQTGMNRRQFDGLADPREKQIKPWFAPRLRSLVDRM